MDFRDDSQSTETEGDYIRPNKTIEDPKDERLHQEDEIAGAEIRRAVNCSRALILSVLACSTIGVAFGVYYYVKGEEDRAFKDQFDEDSLKVLESIGTSLDFTLGAVDSFTVNEVSFAESHNWTWPFVTIPNFAVSASKLRALTKAKVVSQYPLVQENQRDDWEAYSVANEGWVNDGLQTQKNDVTFEGTNVEEWSGWGQIHGNTGYHAGPGPYWPTWQSHPVVPVYSPYNWDISLHYPEEIQSIMDTKKVVIGKTDNLPPDGSNEDYDEQTVQWIKGFIGEDEDPTEPIHVFYYPILENASDKVQNNGAKDEVLGVLALTGFWREFVKDILPPGSNGIIVVFGNDCDQKFTFKIRGPNSEYLGGRDHHETAYDKYVKSSLFADLGQYSISERKYSGAALNTEFCPYWIRVYPSDEMKDIYTTNDPIIFTVVAVSIFLFTSLLFVGYDFLNRTRQQRIMTSALQSNAIVSNLFPAVVRDKVLGPKQEQKHDETPKRRLQTYLREDTPDNKSGEQSKAPNAPIAEFFSETTVLFADIAGFTAWSSVREPAQVFTLLETLYHAFDTIANHRGVFKVETIGDSYVAVTGLPEPRADHAVAMVRFARDCREKTTTLCREMEVSLGPGTGNLEIRFGLNSGPVTAGVLRGERARFQLFGDTVNTAARMESNGKRNKIHVSQSTADLLIAAGKSHWIQKRGDKIEAKGKGVMQTYWCEPNHKAASSRSTSQESDSGKENDQALIDDGLKRLVNWNVEVLSRSLARIVAHRLATKKNSNRELNQNKIEPRGCTLDEVTEMIELPEFDAAIAKRTKNLELATLDPDVLGQLETYVTAIASMYRSNPFHNFEHASHVCMSVSKLLSRIVSPDLDNDKEVASQEPSLLHNYTYGIVSDPLTQFACIFGALIHDVDHPGVSNSQLIKEDAPLAKAYNNKSMAEQNSIDIAWALLNEDSFSALRGAICETAEEWTRFRQLTVNLVMATDILDKDLKTLRNARWARAFAKTSPPSNDNLKDMVNRKATIVLEHLIQASDVAHTMQHWHIYRKWNELFFEEMYTAYISGRGDKDPSQLWYKGELGFFDFYIIPLAKKLRDCGVFGVSSDEYLGYAQRNREEWEIRGQAVVASMVERIQAKYGSPTTSSTF